ncbi:hypothetical protein [Rhodococcus ruber]|uniref:hypothetical protein n=1 Tax=Rhodococcus ruber TaxID=1830 RepID=UPI00265D6181|nr:hypothetical protein [Rhodococcus ruber]MDO1477263.1 hypothetical protein [Rhodococcus ruber]
MVLTEADAWEQLHAVRDELRVARRTHWTLVAATAASVVVGFVGVYLTHVTGDPGFATVLTSTFGAVASVGTVLSFVYSGPELRRARRVVRMAVAEHHNAFLAEGGRP